eukprot:3892626-Amphidinium_carterae.1
MGAPEDPAVSPAPMPTSVHQRMESHRPGESAGSTSVLLRPGDQPGAPTTASELEHSVGEVAVVDLLDIVDTDDDAEAPPRVADQAVDRGSEIVPIVKRRKWALDKLPDHIIAVENDFALRYRCLRCGCMTAAQSRRGFFAKHWECTGEAVMRTTNRHFVRKALLPENKGRRPLADEVLDPVWYQKYGVLPACIVQPVHGGLIHCTVCAVKDRQCNRKKFITRHLGCLSEAILCANNGSYSFLDGVLYRGSKKRKLPVTFAEAGDHTHPSRLLWIESPECYVACRLIDQPL